jgi:hypothetical protein
LWCGDAVDFADALRKLREEVQLDLTVTDAAVNVVAVN